MKKAAIFILIVLVAAVAVVVYYVTRGHGYVKIDTPGVEMHLSGGWFTRTTVRSGGNPARVRATLYRPVRMTISAGENGNTWRLYSRGPWGKLRGIVVDKDETKHIELGPPFVVTTGVHRRQTNVLVGFSMVGRAGEHYQTVVTKNGRTLPAPKLKILDEAGNVLTAGKFEYG
jgi:hypothetical protein